jgi:hypothetical protein
MKERGLRSPWGPERRDTRGFHDQVLCEEEEALWIDSMSVSTFIGAGRWLCG